VRTITTSIRSDRKRHPACPFELVGRLSNALADEIRRAELAQAECPNGASVDAYTLSWRAAAMLPNATTDQALDEVRQLYARAVETRARQRDGAKRIGHDDRLSRQHRQRMRFAVARS
jgi:hypothetical protein